CRISEHLTQWNLGGDDLAGRRVVGPLQETAAPAQVAHDITHVIFRGHHLDLHDRLQQDRIGLVETVLETHRTGDLEGHLVGVDFVVRTVNQTNLDVDHRVSCHRSTGHRFANALVDRWYIFLRHRTADRLVDELVTGATIPRLDLENDMAVLALAARLTHKLAFLPDRLANRLAIGDLRLADVRFDIELATHAVDEDVEMQLTHTGNDRLS